MQNLFLIEADVTISVPHIKAPFVGSYTFLVDATNVEEAKKTFRDHILWLHRDKGAGIMVDIKHRIIAPTIRSRPI